MCDVLCNAKSLRYANSALLFIITCGHLNFKEGGIYVGTVVSLYTNDYFDWSCVVFK